MLLTPRFLFRFAVPCRRCEPLWTDQGAPLTAEHAIPGLAALDHEHDFAEVRAAWSPAGLAFWVQVTGKTQPPWCREARPDESDGLRVWIDTRDTKNIHRASRFCQAFIFMPAGAGRALDDAVASQWLINRAKENARNVRPELLQAHREKRVDGYVLSAFIPAAALAGFDPSEHTRLGFTYALVDRELGTQTFSCSREFPFQEDPSLWGSLELVDG